MAKLNFGGALGDLVASARRAELVGTLGWQDVRQRYRRSSLGPFWLTITMGVMIGTIGIVFGQIFKTPLREYLPFLSIGLILWGFISTSISEGCTGFISSEAIIKQLPIPLPVHILRLLWRNLIILAHNIVIFPIVIFAVGRPLSWVSLLSVMGVVVLVLNLVWFCTLLATVCARYRDISQIVTSLLQVVFYLTPIMWLPNLLPERAVSYFLLELNPFYHLIQIVRAPLLGDFPTPSNWIFSIGCAMVGWVITLIFYGRYRTRIAYWL